MAQSGSRVIGPRAGLQLAVLLPSGSMLGGCGTLQSAGQALLRDDGTAAAAQPAMPAAVQPPAMQGAGQEVYRGKYSYVRIVPAENGAATSFPLVVDEDRLGSLLKELLGAANASFSDRPLFSRAEVAELVPPLRVALGTARSGEDVLFAVTGTHKPLSLTETESVTTGRIFVADGRLNLILGMTRVNFGDALKANGTLRSFEQASRHAGLTTAEAVHGTSWQPIVASRADWLGVPIEKLGYFGTLAAPAVVTPALGAASGGRAPMLAAPATADTLSARASAGASGSTASAASNAEDGAAERRLATLERLRQKGLITQQEFDTKRKAVLDGL